MALCWRRSVRAEHSQVPRVSIGYSGYSVWHGTRLAGRHRRPWRGSTAVLAATGRRARARRGQPGCGILCSPGGQDPPSGLICGLRPSLRGTAVTAPRWVLCRCGHDHDAHRHYRHGSDCALCECPRWSPRWWFR